MNRYRKPIVHGLLIALGFLLGWYAPAVLTYIEGSPSPTQKTPETADTSAYQALKGLGYSSGYEQPEGPTGVLTYDSAAWDGYNLYTSAHRAYVALVDMQGETIHTWHHTFEDAFPNANLPPGTFDVIDMRYWRKVYVYPNGDLLAIHSPYGIVKLDRDSNLLWARHNVEHHDVDVDAEGDIYVLTSERIPYEVEGNKKMRLNDTITVYSNTGQKIQEYDLLEAVRRSDYQGMMGFFGKKAGEFLHTNSLDILPDGDLLLSFRDLHSLARFDPDTRRIEWMLTGRTASQHDAQFIGDGRVTVFDNRNYMQSSRALEIDLDSEEIVWRYNGGEENPFYSRCCGTVQRLPNGNTLVNDSDSGRVFEVTREGRVVWEWVNPHVNEDGKIATTFEFRRYSPDYFSFLQ